MACFHSRGHSGIDATIKRLQSLFYWKTLIQSTRYFISKCDVCQRHKCDATVSPGLLHQLPILDGVWTDICLDFIEGLPTSKGKDVILVVVDRLSKYYHFMSRSHPYTAQFVAQSFLNNVFKLHVIPISITNGRHFSALFGRNCSPYKEFGYKDQQPTIHRQMAKLRS